MELQCTSNNSHYPFSGYVSTPRSTHCQAIGCSAVLTGAKHYCQRKRLCEDHIQAESLQLAGRHGKFRYCFQCGKLEHLCFFDGSRRTCRRALEKRRNSCTAKKPSKRKTRRIRSHKRKAVPATSSKVHQSAGGAGLPDHEIGPGGAAVAADAPISPLVNLAGDGCQHKPAMLQSEAILNVPNVLQDVPPASTLGNATCGCCSQLQAQCAAAGCSSASPEQHTSTSNSCHAIGHQAGMTCYAPDLLPSGPSASSGDCTSSAMSDIYECVELETVLTPAQLRVLLETELTAAALQVVLAPESSSLLSQERNKLPRQLAHRLVSDFRLCDDFTATDCALLGLSREAQPSTHNNQLGKTLSSVSGSDTICGYAAHTLSCSGAAVADHPTPAAPAAAAYTGLAAATAASRPAGKMFQATTGSTAAESSMLLSFVPIHPGAHFRPAAPAMLPTAALPSVPVDNNFQRLNELKQQMAYLHNRLAEMKRQMGLCLQA